jgi:hypothetical protein
LSKKLDLYLALLPSTFSSTLCALAFIQHFEEISSSKSKHIICMYGNITMKFLYIINILLKRKKEKMLKVYNSSGCKIENSLLVSHILPTKMLKEKKRENVEKRKC